MIKGVGMDIVEIERIRKALKTQGKRFLHKVFTSKETAYCLKHKRAPHQHFAARFAAKEAFLKAIKTGWGTSKSPNWREIEVKISSGGAPTLALSGKARAMTRKLKVKQIHLSLTHTESYAAAIVILEESRHENVY